MNPVQVLSAGDTTVTMPDIAPAPQVTTCGDQLKRAASTLTSPFQKVYAGRAVMGRITVPQRCPCPNLLELVTMLPYLAKATLQIGLN